METRTLRTLEDALPTPTRRHVLALSLCGLAGQAAVAQSNVGHIIVPFGAGGARELPARIVLDELNKATGRTWIIENKPGAGGAIGTSYVGQSAPDGNTLLMAGSSHFVTTALGALPRFGYDPIKDFVPVALLGMQSYALLMRSSLPVRNVAELIAYCKARPGACNYNSAGVASSTHLAAAYFCKLAGLQMTHIPYKSTQEAANDMMGGRGDIVFVPAAGLGVYQQDARVRILATTAGRRAGTLPDTPTMAEAGLPAYRFESWFGLLAPSKTPPAVVDKLNTTLNRIVGLPNISAQLKGAGIEPRPLKPAEFNKLFLADQELMTRIVKDSGITRE